MGAINEDQMDGYTLTNEFGETQERWSIGDILDDEVEPEDDELDGDFHNTKHYGRDFTHIMDK